MKQDYNLAQYMSKNQNQILIYSNRGLKNNIEIFLPNLYMCLGNYFKKGNYEMINERAKKLYSQMGLMLIQNLVLKAERIEACGGLIKLK